MTPFMTADSEQGNEAHTGRTLSSRYRSSECARRPRRASQAAHHARRARLAGDSQIRIENKNTIRPRDEAEDEHGSAPRPDDRSGSRQAHSLRYLRVKETLWRWSLLPQPSRTSDRDHGELSFNVMLRLFIQTRDGASPSCVMRRADPGRAGWRGRRRSTSAGVKR